MNSDAIFAKLDQWSAETWPELMDSQIALILGEPACSLRGLDDGQLDTIRKLAKIGQAYICANKMRVSEEQANG